jgi:hypothetical protein
MMQNLDSEFSNQVGPLFEVRLPQTSVTDFPELLPQQLSLEDAYTPV